jgi:hypothetical protein
VTLGLVHENQSNPTNMLEVPKGIPVVSKFFADLSPMTKLGHQISPTNPGQLRGGQPGFQSSKEAGLVLHDHYYTAISSSIPASSPFSKKLRYFSYPMVPNDFQPERVYTDFFAAHDPSPFRTEPQTSDPDRR